MYGLKGLRAVNLLRVSTKRQSTQQKTIELNEKLEDEKKIRNGYVKINKNLSSWIKEYDNSPIEKRKALLYEVIDKVDIYKDATDITFKIDVNSYKTILGSVND